MEGIAASDRVPFKWWQYIGLTALVLLGVAGGGYVWYVYKGTEKDLANAFGGGAVTLLFGSLLGGIVSLLVAELQRLRVRRAANIEYITNLLSDVKAVYDKVDRGRTLIAAHQSAKTYGDEMRNFIEARVKLLQVVRALKFDQRGSKVATILPRVESMEGYLKLLIDEFSREYKEISRLQSMYEARMASMMKALGPLPVTEKDAPELPRNAPWEKIAALKQIRDFLEPVDDCQDLKVPAGTGSAYCSQFLTPLDAVSSALRNALEAQF